MTTTTYGVVTHLRIFMVVNKSVRANSCWPPEHAKIHKPFPGAGRTNAADCRA